MTNIQQDITDQTRPDHDLLIILGTKFDSMASDIKDLKDGTTQRLAQIELNMKANVSRIETAEKDLVGWKSAINTLRWGVGVIIAILTIIAADTLGLLKIFVR